jgi:RNA polymerase-binding transcription factor DksA
MIDEQAAREKLESARDQVRARIERIQGNERRETSEGQTDGAHLWEDADIRDADLGEPTDELSSITDALQRLDLGSYGICSSCGQPIPEGRLEVMPYAVTCVDCAES